MPVIANWGQLQDEGDKAYASFCVYRNMGVKRSLRKCAREVGKGRTQIERWSTRHKWQVRVAAWDLEQQDLRREARLCAVQEMEERHGKLARALLGRVAAQLGSQVKGRCKTCGRSPTELTGPQISSALKAGVEVERLALGQSTAGAAVITQNTVNVSITATTSLVLLRDAESQQLATKLLSRMKSLDPATSLRRLAGARAAGARAALTVTPVTGHAAVKAAQAQALADRSSARTVARGQLEELGIAEEETPGEAAQREAETKAAHRRARVSKDNRLYREKVAAAAAADDDDEDLFPEPADAEA